MRRYLISDILNPLVYQPVDAATKLVKTMQVRAARMTDAFLAGLDIQEHLQFGKSLIETFEELEIRTDNLEDGYPKWHPASYPFHGILKPFFYHEVIGDSYRKLFEHQELASVVGLG